MILNAFGVQESITERKKRNHVKVQEGAMLQPSCKFKG